MKLKIFLGISFIVYSILGFSNNGVSILELIPQEIKEEITKDLDLKSLLNLSVTSTIMLKSTNPSWKGYFTEFMGDLDEEKDEIFYLPKPKEIKENIIWETKENINWLLTLLVNARDIVKKNIEYIKKKKRLPGETKKDRLLMFANLSDTNLPFVNLNSANLRDANLSKAMLTDAKLNNANLKYANLRATILMSSKLNSVDLSSANLAYAKLNNSDVQNCNLTETKLNETNLTSTDLIGCYILEKDFTKIPITRDYLRSKGAIWGEKFPPITKESEKPQRILQMPEYGTQQGISEDIDIWPRFDTYDKDTHKNPDDFGPKLEDIGK